MQMRLLGRREERREEVRERVLHGRRQRARGKARPRERGYEEVILSFWKSGRICFQSVRRRDLQMSFEPSAEALCKGRRGMDMKSFVSRTKNPYLYFGSLGKSERQYAIPNFIGLALYPSHDREIQHNAADQLPFLDASIAKVQSQDVFEHIPRDTVPAVLNEIYRVIRIGGVFRLSVPDYRSPLLKRRSIYDSSGRVVADLMMCGTAKYNPSTTGLESVYSKGGDAHLWFPTYESILELIIKSDLRRCDTIRFYHYFIDDERYVCEPFPENEMFVMRAPPMDNRADGKPISIIVDFVK